MKFEFQNKKMNQVKADLVLVLVINKDLKHKSVTDLKFLKEQNFKGGPEEVCFLPHKNKIYLGVENLELDNLRSAAARVVRFLKTKKYKSLKMGLYGENFLETTEALVEGFLLGGYNFDKYKSKKKKASLSRIKFFVEGKAQKEIDIKEMKRAIQEGEIVARATNYTRDMVNTIPAEITPVTMSEIAKELADRNGLGIKVHGEKYLEKEGMGAFLAVSKASPYPPQLIHLTYKAENPVKKITIVGKGLTYDSGGLSLKPSDFMLTMKSDKGGASAVLGIMKAASELKLPLEIHGIIGAVENMIGQHAYKPDDVLIAKNKKTIEVINTDAEGRLVLADCLGYAQDLKPDYVIDLATLTGACVIALGEYTVGIMGHSDELKGDFYESSKSSGELAETLGFNKHLAKLITSEVADIRNTGKSRYGGAQTAGLFLNEFIEKKNKDKWIHLDIAGPAYVQSPWGVNPYGASGAGVRLVTSWLEKLSE